MAGVTEKMIKKGYIPLAATELAGIGWRGEHLNDFWMWNKKFNEFEGGIKHIRTVKVSELKEAALHYWRDGWVPLRPLSTKMLRKMEAALRTYTGLKDSSIEIPDGEFLKEAEHIPLEFIGPELRAYLDLPDGPDPGPLVPKELVASEILVSFKAERKGSL
jgi:hypothetical protein